MYDGVELARNAVVITPGIVYLMSREFMGLETVISETTHVEYPRRRL